MVFILLFVVCFLVVEPVRQLNQSRHPLPSAVFWERPCWQIVETASTSLGGETCTVVQLDPGGAERRSLNA